MKAHTRLLIACSLVFFMGCRSESTDSSGTTEDGIVSDSADAKVQGNNGNLTNWTIVPGQQVGVITPAFTEADIINAFGSNNVLRNEMAEPESEQTYITTVVFPNTRNRLTVRWKPDQQFQKIDYIRIEGDSTDWRTAEGITIGTTLEELIRINGKDFKFNGFYEAGEAGMTQSWEGGNVNPALVLYLDPVNVQYVHQGEGLSKEASYSSDNPLAKKAGIRVAGMVVKM